MRKKTNQIPHLSKVMNIRVPNSLFLEIVKETKRLDLTASHFGRLAMTKLLREVSGRKNLYEAAGFFMTLSQQELAKLLKNADEHVTLNNDMKSTAVDEKMRTLIGSIKKILSKKDATVEIFVMKGKVD